MTSNYINRKKMLKIHKVNERISKKLVNVNFVFFN